MATTAADVSRSAQGHGNPPGRRYDHYFFSGMALLILATVFLGFAHTYYLAGVFHAPLPARIIHIHGALFTSWILLLLAQTSLVFAGRTDIHRRLGIAGFLLACFMVMAGILAGTNALARGSSPGGLDPQTFYVIPMGDMFIFSVLIFFAFRVRFNPSAHKRIILIATTGLMIAAIARWPFALTFNKPIVATLFTYVFLLLLWAYDWWSTRKIHRATIWASLSLIVIQWIRVPIGQTAAWHSFANWAQKLAS